MDVVALLPREARDHEPLLALDGGEDGLDLVRRIAAASPTLLASGGVAVVELGRRQLDAALAVFAAAGLQPSASLSDEGSVVVARS